MIKLRLPSRYDYTSSLSFAYPGLEPTPELWFPDRKVFVFPVEDKAVLVRFKKNYAYIENDLNSREEALKHVASKLNLNPYGLRAMSEGLDVAGKIRLLKRYPHVEGFLPPRLGDPPRWLYSGLIKTIILQMLSYKAARIMISRFVKAFGGARTFKGVNIYTFPEPELVYGKTEEEIKKGATVSMAKAKAIREVARLELEGDLRVLEALAWENPDKAARELVKIPGVGYWTAYVSLMAGLGVWHASR